MDGYTLSISRCSGGDGVEESFKAKIKRREAALDAFAVAEAYCKGIGMECTVHLLAGMPVCYIYRQQGGRQPSRPMAEGTSR